MSLRALENTGGSGAGAHHAAGHGQRVSMQYENIDQQNESYIVGMWSFLVTEIMFFGALFLAYTLYRILYFDTYLEAHQFLNPTLGGLNTFVLLTSSLTMVLAVYFGQHGKRWPVIGLLAITCVCAFGFMVVKYFEYTSKINEGLLPDQNFNYARGLYMHHHEAEEAGQSAEGGHNNPRARRAWTALEAAKAEGGVVDEEGLKPAVALVSNPATGFDTRITTPAAGTITHPVTSPAVAAYEQEAGHAKLFFSIYFCMTGLHGIHVLIGIAMMGVLMLLYLTKNPAVDDYMPLEMIGLYWHFVDLVWIFLFPLMYLIS